jgi:DNA repair protein RadC
LVDPKAAFVCVMLTGGFFIKAFIMVRPNMPDDNIHAGHRERLRKRFLEDGLDGFEDHQILELLLFHAIPRGDTNPIAHLLMRRFGSLSAVLEADPKDIAGVKGIGEKAAVFLSMIPQVTRRYFHDRVVRSKPQLNTSEAVSKYLIPLMAGRPEEVFYVLCLDTQCRVVYPALVSEGTIKEAAVFPRQVVEEALRHRAASVILAHNHPGGTTKPSQQDRRLTGLLIQALGPLDIKVLDHIIVAGDQAFSFARDGILPGYEAS